MSRMERKVTTELLDEHSAARYLGGNKPLSIRTLQRHRLTGDGPPYIKIGAAVRYHRDDLDQYIATQRRLSTSEHHEKRQGAPDKRLAEPRKSHRRRKG
jgi:hypothetical protein